MTELIVRLAIVCAVVFGVAYGLTRAVKISRHRRQEQARAAAAEKLAALKRSLEEKEISVEEYDQLSRAIYMDCQDNGIAIDDL